jgi:hypothetical protein
MLLPQPQGRQKVRTHISSLYPIALRVAFSIPLRTCNDDKKVSVPPHGYSLVRGLGTHPDAIPKGNNKERVNVEGG